MTLLYLCNDTSTTDIYTLSLHDALPISEVLVGQEQHLLALLERPGEGALGVGRGAHRAAAAADERLEVGRGVHRSEEHTSELQSQSNLVCRLLLEKKKKQ